MDSKELKNFIIGWNNLFRLDRWWRKKYNVAFNSKEHREVCQLDIVLEYLEDQAYEEAVENRERLEKMRIEYEKGNWLKEQGSLDEDEQDLFDKIDIGNFNVGEIDIE